MSDLRICHECEDAFCAAECCDPICHHGRVMCQPCAQIVGCWECADDDRGERDLNHLRGK